MKTFICGLGIVLFAAALTNAQTNSGDDDAAIKVTALNYIEGWYEGDAARMESALHPELAKRMISTDPKTGHSQFNHMGAMQLVQNTRHGGGNKTPKDQGEASWQLAALYLLYFVTLTLTGPGKFSIDYLRNGNQCLP